MLNDFLSLQSFVTEINSSNSTNHKIDVLTKYQSDQFVRQILHYTYHPYKQYGVSSDNLKKRTDLVAPSNLYTNLFQLLDDLNDRNITGHHAIEAVNAFIHEHKEFAHLIYQIFDRNLETRATTTLINRVMPGLIPTFSVALAHDINKVKKIDLLDGSWYVSRKLDGVRCLAIVRGGEVKFFSRNGKEFETLSRVKEEILRLGLTDCVLDGEICLMQEDGSDDFQGILKQIQRKEHTIQNPKYWVFDILTLEEFDSAVGTTPLADRLTRTIFEGDVLELLPQHLILSENSLNQLKDSAKGSGWEGLIARRNVGYEGDRTKNMLKLKEMHDAEYVVLETIMGPQRVIVEGKEVEEEVLSAVIIEHKGGRVQVGSGYSLEERRHYFQHPEEILGSTITVQYFEETVDQEGKPSLRFPVFKANHGKNRTT